MQREDIDLLIDIGDKKDIKISEKLRQKNYGDVLLEVWSLYENEVPGWFVEGKSDLLCIFFRDYKNPQVAIINTQELRAVYELFKDQITNSDWDYLIRTNKTRSVKRITVNGKAYDCTLVRAENETYNTMSVCVPFSMLESLEVRHNFCTFAM